jgi:hypothetical protein
VLVRLGTLRTYIREGLTLMREVGANNSFPGQPYGRNVLSPDINSREQLGAISAKAIDTVGDPEGEGMPDHLINPAVSPEDCYGPVPPEAEPPHVGSDPFAKDVNPNPTGSIKRGPTRV